MKHFYLMMFLLFYPLIVLAQEAQIKGRVVDINSSDPISGVQVQILESIYSADTDVKGVFYITSASLPQGEQVLVVRKDGYNTQRIHITIQNGKSVNLDPILFELNLTEIQSQIGVISLSDNELDGDDGTSFNVSGLLQSSRDAFLNAAAFDFSATFFRPRGYDNANGKVLINGLEMNKFSTGRPQWSNWGGLNDVQRNREFSQGLKANDYVFGDVAGTTNIIMRASQYRQGGQVSYAAASASYKGRIMGSYNSGLLQNGWAYSVLLSRRFGDKGYQDATLYDANSFFAAIEKKINNNHSVNFTTFYTPNRRGRSTPVTQEVANLKGIRYNPNWGYQGGVVRNSRVREIEEPVFMLNHFWDVDEKTFINTNIGFQTGKNGQTRLDTGGTRLVLNENGEESYVGGARNPFGNYYQNLPSFALSRSQTTSDFANAFLLQQDFVNDGQLNWNAIYEGNRIVREQGGNAIYAIQEDRTDDTTILGNIIASHYLNDNIILNGNISFRNLKSENFAELHDLLGGIGYLDVDFFAGDDGNSQEVNVTGLGDIAQSDLRNRNRIVQVGDRYKYNYEITANEVSAFAQAQFKYNTIDFYTALSISGIKYQRNGLFENGNFQGSASFGESETLSFSNFGLKAGATYKVTGRHLVDVNLGMLQKAPNIRNSFSNARVSNATTIGIEEQKINNVDVSYIFRSPLLKTRLTAYYTGFKDGSDIGFYFTENIAGQGIGQDAFIQEILTNIDTRNIGLELGIEAQVTTTIKLTGVVALGQNTYTNNPDLYITSDDLDGAVTFGDGTTKLKGYHVAGGPERALQFGFEYRDPAFWNFGVSTNYFSNAYIDVNNLARSDNFTLDFDGNTQSEYDPIIARDLLRQEQFDDYILVNMRGGKSWRVKDYFVGFFASINNVLDQDYKTGGFEQGRKTNFRDLREDTNLQYGRVFGPRYFFGFGSTYYVNVYIRF